MKQKLLTPLFLPLKLKLPVILPVILIATIFLFSSCTAKPQSAAPAEMTAVFSEAGLPFYLNKVTPREFSLQTLTGETLSLSGLQGKVVFLNFWATWCGPCVIEMPSMEAIYKRYREKGLEILAVNFGESQAEVQAFMNNHGLSFPALLDEDGRTGGSYGIQAIPTSFLIDRDGNVVSRLVGSIDWDTPEIHAVIESLLNS